MLKTDRFSGAENVTLMIMRLLPKDKYDCIYASLDGEIRNHVEECGLKFYPMKDSSFGSIKRVVEDIRPTIIHATDYGMSSMSVWVAGSIPVVAHLHNNVPWLQKWYNPKNLFFSFALPRINQIISVSEAIQKEFCHGKMFSGKNTVIENIVDIEQVREKANEDVPMGEYDVIFLGRLTPQKKPLYFLNLIYKIKIQKPDLKVCMIGDGELREEVEQTICKLGLKGCIRLLGFQKNPYKYVKKGKVLLMPSAWEGFGLAAVESMALGKPVVCSGVGGLKAIVNDENGRICQTDEEYIQESIQLLADASYYAKKSKQAMISAVQFGNQDAYISKIMRVYDLCLEGKA